MRRYSPNDACKIAIERIVKKPKSNYKNFQVGYIALNKKGVTGSYSIQKILELQHDKMAI